MKTLVEKVPREEALGITRELVSFLKPHCMRIIVAGSLRRRKEFASDIEILFIPRFVTEPDPGDFLGATLLVNATERAINEGLLLRNILAIRPNKNGVAAWGEKNKLGLHPESGLAVDLFTATEENWFNYLVCRTGSAENNVRICNAAISRGWKWNPYGVGFSRPTSSPKLVDNVYIQSEREVFEFVRLPYLEPWELA